VWDLSLLSPEFLHMKALHPPGTNTPRQTKKTRITGCVLVFCLCSRVCTMGPNGVGPCGVGVFGNFRSGALRMLYTKVGHLFSGESSWARGRRHNHKLRTRTHQAARPVSQSFTGCLAPGANQGRVLQQEGRRVGFFLRPSVFVGWHWCLHTTHRFLFKANSFIVFSIKLHLYNRW